MKDNGILSEEEYAKMRELYDEKIALKKLKKIEYIVCETEAEQREKREKGSPENETPTRDSGYKKYIINEFGGETTTEEYIKTLMLQDANGNKKDNFGKEKNRRLEKAYKNQYGKYKSTGIYKPY